MSKLKEIYDGLMRKQGLKIMTCNLGRIVEEEDKIVCFVDKRVEKMKKIGLFNFDSDKNIEISEKFNIHKPICYVFDNIDYSSFSGVMISGYDNVDVIMKNCKLPQHIVINGNCHICDCYYFVHVNSDISARKIYISDCYITCDNNFSISGVDDVLISNTTINSVESYFTSFHSEKNMIFDSVNISCNNILSFESPHICSKNSSFSGTIVNIKSNEFNEIFNDNFYLTNENNSNGIGRIKKKF